MTNNDIEVIEVGVEGENYEFFNDPANTNQFDISNMKFVHSLSDSANFQNFDNVEDMNYSNDVIEKNTSHKLPTDQTE